MKRTICLNMIVKNESHVIQRCLESVRPLIDYWVIVDTGSTDGTQDIIRTTLSNLPGELHERPWKNFGHNRSEALQLARGKTDYTFIIDADEVLITAPGFRMPDLRADEYKLLCQSGQSSTVFYRTQLIRSSLPWRYVGVLHEYIECPEPHSDEKLQGLTCHGFFDSARNVDEPRAKYERDAQILRKALEDDPDNARYVFYLAQSYRDADCLDDAIETYQRRVAMGGWGEEVWYSLFQIAELLERKEGANAQVVEAYLRAYEDRPARAEPLCSLARHYRVAGDYALSYLFASRAAQTPLPEDILFLDQSVYEWRALDELAVAAYWLGKYRESFEANERLLYEGKLPEDQIERIAENREFAKAKLDAPDAETVRDLDRALADLESGEIMSYIEARITYEACPLCDSQSLAEEKIVSCANHAIYKPSIPPKMRWLKCETCSHIFTEGYFTAEALEILFSDVQANQRPGYDLHGTRMVSSRMVEKICRALGKQEGRWLDVGFGNGALMATADEYGFDVAGLDLRQESVQLMQTYGFDAEAVDLINYEPEAPFDIVTMADVLEHMPFPKAALEQVREILNGGGLLFLSMPNSDCFVWDRLNDLGANPFWAEIEHYHNFGKARLYALLEETGFEPLAYGISERYYICMEVIARKR